MQLGNAPTLCHPATADSRCSLVNFQDCQQQRINEQKGYRGPRTCKVASCNQSFSVVMFSVASVCVKFIFDMYGADFISIKSMIISRSSGQDQSPVLGARNHLSILFSFRSGRRTVGGRYVAQARSFKVTDVSTSRKPVFDFLLMNNILTYILAHTAVNLPSTAGAAPLFNTIFRSEHLNSEQKKLETGNIALLYYSTKFISILIPM